MTRIFVLLACVILSGCSAGRATYFLIDADRAYKDAVAAEAAEHATYEFTLAEAYRAKAWEEWGYSKYQIAEELALTSTELARKAEQIALHGDEERQLMEDLEGMPEDLEGP